MWYDVKKREWKMLPEDELIRKLSWPEGRIDMVLDTDTYNEVDDQFSLVYCMLSPERLNVEAVYAAPFYNGRCASAAEGMILSYNEILRLLGKMNIACDGLVFEGSREFMPEAYTPVDSPAARDLVRRAMARDADDPLYVVAIGAITNVASAILMEPEITGRIVVIWLGGQPTSYPYAGEFNLSQDVAAARIVFDCGAPVIMIPCYGVASHMLTSLPELKECIGGRNDVSDALIELFVAYSSDHFGWTKAIWDLAPIGWLMNQKWVPSHLSHSPLLTDDSHWGCDARRHLIREAYYCHRNPIFKDLFNKLNNI